MAEVSDQMIENILKHLDSETQLGAMRMSVGVDETQQEESVVSHKCCYAYGKPATDTVAKLDMYSDLYLSDMKEGEDVPHT